VAVALLIFPEALDTSGALAPARLYGPAVSLALTRAQAAETLLRSAMATRAEQSIVLMIISLLG
jgi:hypothetical protein